MRFSVVWYGDFAGRTPYSSARAAWQSGKEDAEQTFWITDTLHPETVHEVTVDTTGTCDEGGTSHPRVTQKTAFPVDPRGVSALWPPVTAQGSYRVVCESLSAGDAESVEEAALAAYDDMTCGTHVLMVADGEAQDPFCFTVDDLDSVVPVGQVSREGWGPGVG